MTACNTTKIQMGDLMNKTDTSLASTELIFPRNQWKEAYIHLLVFVKDSSTELLHGSESDWMWR